VSDGAAIETAGLSKTYRGGVRALVGWVVGLVAHMALIAAIFPSIEGSPDLDELVLNYPDAHKALFGLSEGGDITSGAGYVDRELFSFMLPLLVLVPAIGSGARTFAGEEDAGRLELVMAYPVRRAEVVVAKAGAVAIEVAVVCVAALAALLLLDPVFGLDLPKDNLVGGMAGVALLGVLHGWLALAVGAAVPSRALAVGVPAALAAAGYLVNGLHELAGWLDPFRFLSPFWWLGTTPLRSGVDAGGMLVVAAGCAMVLAAAVTLVDRRDLETP
jgi:ABC-2 type transport system permease protein